MRECHLARSYALQPVHPQTLGLGFQMVSQTHRTVKTAAKLRNRLQPRLGRDLEPIENRFQALKDPKQSAGNIADDSPAWRQKAEEMTQIMSCVSD